MTIKLGVYGEKKIVHRVQEIAKQLPSIDVLPFILTGPDDTWNQTAGAMMCDVLLFTDYSYHENVDQKYKQTIFYIDYDEYSILSSALHAGKFSEKKCLSMDYPEDVQLAAFAHEIAVTEYEFISTSYKKQDQLSTQELVDFHKQLFFQQKTDIILTSRRDVYSKLFQEGLPVHRMHIPDKCIFQSLEKIVQTWEEKHQSSHSVITGIFRLKQTNSAPIHQPTHMEVRNRLNQFCEKYDAILLPDKDNGYFIIGTNKLIQVITESYRSFPLLYELEELAGCPVCLAFGLGVNPLASQKNAYLALEACYHEQASLCYLVNAYQEKMGPIGRQKNIDTNKLLHALVHQARLNNELSYLFIQFIVERNNEPFSSHDISAFYRISKRSAERTVKKLLSGDIIKISGKERQYTKGRPRKLFILNH
ncbi:hypothetical protein [Oceanobacillus timonensis]|uniref:hypothetical protein n=1 Tax=Oceanobacillus timonensis TaxID=1926285 RepID=UPI0009BAE59A|nr:hypothetical protein [Oceanobacillus timonensis]